MIRYISVVAWLLAAENTSIGDAFCPTSSSISPSTFSPVLSRTYSSAFGLHSSLEEGGEADFSDYIFDDVEDDMEDLNFDDLPDFIYERKNDVELKVDDEDGDKSSAPDSDEEPYTDYCKDYEDENEFHIPNRLGVSTRCWGDENQGFVSSGKLKKKQLREGKFAVGDLQAAYNRLLQEGIILFETSPAYGKSSAKVNLSSENLLSRFNKENNNSTSPLIVDTFDNKIWQRSSGAFMSALTASYEKLDLDVIDIYQAKNIGWLPSGGIINGMEEAFVEQGTVDFVGVQDISPLRMRRLNEKFDDLGFSITTNSFEFSLTDRKKEKWIKACKSSGVIPLVRNPLGSGLASGQYTATNPNGGVASSGNKFSFKKLEKYQPLHTVLESVAETVRTRLLTQKRKVKDRRDKPGKKINTDITTTQVAWNYIVAKGAVPLVEVNSEKQAEELIGSLGWSLTDDEVSMLETAADLCS